MSASRWIVFLVLGACSGAACERSPATPVRAVPSEARAPGICEHGLTASVCTRCNPSLIPVFQAKGDWCAAHEFPESLCPICNPARPEHGRGHASGSATDFVTGASEGADWCSSHGLPESKCTRCRPALVPGFRAAGDWCSRHEYPESVCPICNPQSPPVEVVALELEARTVRLQRPEIEEDAGIVTVAARQASTTQTVSCPAHISFDADRVSEVRTLFPGMVEEVKVRLGDRVEPGNSLFTLRSVEVRQVQGALQKARERTQTALAEYERTRSLHASGIASERELELATRELAHARSDVKTSEANLRMTGARSSAPSGRYNLTALRGGTIVDRSAVVGHLATENEPLATIADTSVMWASCQVSEVEASSLRIDQRAEVLADGRGESWREGRVIWLSPEVDPKTRTVTARIELANPHGRLRNHQYARGRIHLREAREGVVVPRAAVQRVGDLEVVFVRTAPGEYEPRVVESSGADDPVEVRGRVRVGERVATTGAVLLRTEIMPGAIGAGCCEVEGPGGD